MPRLLNTVKIHYKFSPKGKFDIDLRIRSNEDMDFIPVPPAAIFQAARYGDCSDIFIIFRKS